MNIKTIKTKLISLANRPNFRNVVFISSLYFFGRILGFFRTILLGQKLDPLSQELILNADKIPTLIASVLLMGTVYNSVFPVFSRLETQNSETNSQSNSKDYFNLMVVILVFGVLILTFVGFLFTESILKYVTSPVIWDKVVAGGLVDEYFLTCRILLLTPINFCIQALYGVILNFKKKFVIFSLAGIFANIFSILGLFLSGGSIVNFAIGMTAGVTFSSLVYVLYCYKLGYVFNTMVLRNFWGNLRLESVEIKQTFMVFWPRIFLIDGFLVAFLLLGKYTTSENTNYAFDLATSIQNVFYILITSLGIISLPEFSQSIKNKELFWTKIKLYLKNSFLIGGLVTILCVFGAPLVMWIFELFGKIKNDTSYIILLTQVGAIKLVFHSIKEIIEKYFYAIESRYKPIIISICSNVFQVGVFFVLRELQVDIGICAILSMTSYYMVWAIISVFLIKKDHQNYQLNTL
jgi:putative peptidoglycan lipid II flippase